MIERNKQLLAVGLTLIIQTKFGLVLTKYVYTALVIGYNYTGPVLFQMFPASQYPFDTQNSWYVFAPCRG